jgi:hypothetical protein
MSRAAFSRLVLPSMNRSNLSAGCEHPGVRCVRYHRRQPAFEPPGHQRRSTFSEIEATSRCAYQVDPESRSRIPLPRREDLNSEGQKIFDCFTSGSKGVLRGLRGPRWHMAHEPKLAEVHVAFGKYLSLRAGLREPVREACVLAMARECNSAFEWAAHEPEPQSGRNGSVANVGFNPRSHARRSIP